MELASLSGGNVLSFWEGFCFSLRSPAASPAVFRGAWGLARPGMLPVPPAPAAQEPGGGSWARAKAKPRLCHGGIGPAAVGRGISGGQSPACPLQREQPGPCAHRALLATDQAHPCPFSPAKDPAHPCSVPPAEQTLPAPRPVPSSASPSASSREVFPEPGAGEQLKPTQTRPGF